jgi:hypothetical protein
MKRFIIAAAAAGLFLTGASIAPAAAAPATPGDARLGHGDGAIVKADWGRDHHRRHDEHRRWRHERHDDRGRHGHRGHEHRD